ncbi:hypothetical protein BASA81_012100 [Batrachochytrium salamandrivorans]|nr:hypothetical protein BASA81_012100 [Batrachochytrium salamandrivorans]
MFAVVTLDGIPYSTTATPNSLFRMTSTTPPLGWNTNVYFNDAGWYTQTMTPAITTIRFGDLSFQLLMPLSWRDATCNVVP